VEALTEQARKVIHSSNFYYHESQGRLAQSLVNLIGPGKCFFGNSGVEANEGLFKLARKFVVEELFGRISIANSSWTEFSGEFEQPSFASTPLFPRNTCRTNQITSD